MRIGAQIRAELKKCFWYRRIKAVAVATCGVVSKQVTISGDRRDADCNRYFRNEKGFACRVGAALQSWRAGWRVFAVRCRRGCTHITALANGRSNTCITTSRRQLTSISMRFTVFVDILKATRVLLTFSARAYPRNLHRNRCLALKTKSLMRCGYRGDITIIGTRTEITLTH